MKAQGRAADTPAALVEKRTTAKQRVFIGDLDSLPGLIADQQVRAPTLIIVGEVVALHNKLNWYRPGEEIGQL
jgi:uroporphyrin-III C-methyltransferase/precorrin-2 dehydrogenase/sirohydrochlorin ferrochelatase